MTDWRRWTNEDQHPWVKKGAEEGCEEDRVDPYIFERRLYSPVKRLWPLVSMDTRVYVSKVPDFAEKDFLKSPSQRSLYGVHESLQGTYKLAAPMVRLGLMMKAASGDPWEEHSLGIPFGLVSEAVDMLEKAAETNTDFHCRSSNGSCGWVGCPLKRGRRHPPCPLP